MNSLQKTVLVFLIAGSIAAGYVASSIDGQSGAKGQAIASVPVRPMLMLRNLFNFEEYQKLFGKHYSSILEKAMRAKIYLASAFRAFISTIAYKQHQTSMYLSVNQMSDWTRAEFKQTLSNVHSFGQIDNASVEPIARQSDEGDQVTVGTDLLDISAEKGNKNDKIELDHSAIDKKLELDSGLSIATDENELRMNPTDEPDVMFVDHRDCLPPVEIQRACNSCYAFASMALYEWAYCKAKNKVTKLSKQYVIDCGKRNRYLYGCDSGSAMHVREFVLNNGLHFESEYPYEAQVGQCRYQDSDPAELRGSVRIYDQGWTRAKLATLEDDLRAAPLVIHVNVNDNCSNLMDYGGGVDNSIDCAGSDWFHAMTLVGSGRENGQEYFLVRNSWGVDWGEEGYYKISKRHKSLENNQGLVVKFSTPPVVDEASANESEEEKSERNKLMQLIMSVDSLKEGIPR